MLIPYLVPQFVVWEKYRTKRHAENEPLKKTKLAYAVSSMRPSIKRLGIRYLK